MRGRTTARALLEAFGVGTDARPHDQELEEQGGTGLRITGDPDSMKMLLSVFSGIAQGDPWVDECKTALEQAMQRGGGNVTLPKFQGQGMAQQGIDGEEETP